MQPSAWTSLPLSEVTRRFARGEAEPVFPFHVGMESTLSVTYNSSFQKQRRLSPNVHTCSAADFLTRIKSSWMWRKSLARKKVVASKRFLLINNSFGSPSPLLFRCSRSDYDVSPSMVRLAPVMKAASSDAR